jgi:hypothetical protein
MSLRTIVLIAASLIIGVACIAAVSTETFARTPHGLKHLDHHSHHHPRGVHHSGQVQPHHGTKGNAARAAR